MWQNLNRGLAERHAHRAGENPTVGHSIYFLSKHNGGDGFLCSYFQNLILFGLFIALIESDVILSLTFIIGKNSEKEGYHRHLVNMDAHFDYPEQMQQDFWC